MTDITAAAAAKTPYLMRKQPRQRRAQATVDAILEAAARISEVYRRIRDEIGDFCRALLVRSR